MKEIGTNLLACLPIFDVLITYIRSEYEVPTKRAISEELQHKNGYSLSSRYFPIHSKEKTNKRLDETRINENFCQCSFLSLVRHFVCFENGHRHGDHVMAGNVDHCFRFFQNWHTPELIKQTGSVFGLFYCTY